MRIMSRATGSPPVRPIPSKPARFQGGAEVEDAGAAESSGGGSPGGSPSPGRAAIANPVVVFSPAEHGSSLTAR